MAKTYYIDKRVFVDGGKSVTNLQNSLNLKDYVQDIVDDTNESGLDVSLQDGSASEPALFFDSDIDTGIFYGGTGQLNITSGSTEVWEIDATSSDLKVGNLILDAGNLTITDGNVSITETANAKAFAVVATTATTQTATSITADSITTANGLGITMDAITSGDMISLNSDGSTMLTTGSYINCQVSGATFFSVGNVGQVTARRNFEVITGSNVITKDETGKTFYLNHTTGAAQTLPAPAIGLYFKFVISTQPTSGNMTVVTNGGANVIEGGADVNSVFLPASNEDTISFVASTAIIGDWVEVESNGTSWFVTGASGGGAGAITFTA